MTTEGKCRRTGCGETEQQADARITKRRRWTRADWVTAATLLGAVAGALASIAPERWALVAGAASAMGYAVARALSGTAGDHLETRDAKLNFAQTSVSLNGVRLEGARLESGPDGALHVFAPLRATLERVGLNTRVEWRQEDGESVLDVQAQ